jgi:hypothetical protein
VLAGEPQHGADQQMLQDVLRAAAQVTAADAGELRRDMVRSTAA